MRGPRELRDREIARLRNCELQQRFKFSTTKLLFSIFLSMHALRIVRYSLLPSKEIYAKPAIYDYIFANHSLGTCNEITKLNTISLSVQRTWRSESNFQFLRTFVFYFVKSHRKNRKSIIIGAYSKVIIEQTIQDNVLFILLRWKARS